MKIGHFSLVWIFVLILALAGCSSSSSGGGGNVIDDPGDGGGIPCPDPRVSIMITAPDTNASEIVIPLGQYTFMATVATTYPNRTDVTWTIDGVEYDDTDFAGGISQITVTFNAEEAEIDISVRATCTATDLSTDTDTDSCVARVGNPVPSDPLDLEAGMGCSGDGFYAIITPSPENHLYTWGENDHGQLGLGHNVDQAMPQRVLPALADKRWYSVAFHGFTVYATDFNGKLWAWGEGFTSTPTILAENTANPYLRVQAGDLHVIVTTWMNKTYWWSDANLVPFDDRSLFIKTGYVSGLTVFNPEIAGSNLHGYIIYQDSGGNLLITDIGNGDYECLELGWGADDYAISDTSAAFIRDGKLYVIEDVEQKLTDYLDGLYPPGDYSYIEQVGTDSDWVMVYSSLDGIIAVKESAPENTLHMFGDMYPADVYPDFTAVNITTLVEADERTVDWGEYSLYIPDGARF